MSDDNTQYDVNCTSNSVQKMKVADLEREESQLLFVLGTKDLKNGTTLQSVLELMQRAGATIILSKKTNRRLYSHYANDPPQSGG